MRDDDLKVGDIVENFGFKFDKMGFFEKIPYKFKWWWTDFRYWCRKQKEKLKYGFPLEDSFDFYSGLIQYALPRLKLFRKRMGSHPPNFTFEQWQEIVDKMIWSMEHWEDEVFPIYPDNYDSRNIITNISERGTTYKKLDERPLDYTPVKEHDEKVIEGFELFGKYLTHLWN